MVYAFPPLIFLPIQSTILISPKILKLKLQSLIFRQMGTKESKNQQWRAECNLICFRSCNEITN